MCTFLDDNHPRASDFVDCIHFLKTSVLLFALTENPILYEEHHDEFWGSAQIVEAADGVRNIRAEVQGTVVVISEAVIR